MNKKLLLFSIPVILALLSPGIYFYTKYQKTAEELRKVTPGSKEEVTTLLVQVGKLMVLPTDEEPTVATVTDKEKLKSQNFFVTAENGDKVIIYTKNQKAILYRPSLNKIIEVAKVGSLSSEASSSATLATPPVTAVYNGTETVGLSKVFETRVKGKVDLNILLKQNAAKKDYQKSVVVDVNKKSTVAAQKVAQYLNAPLVDVMPDGEATPSADILVILGSDFK